MSQKGAEEMVEAEENKWGQVMRRLDDLGKKIEDGFRRMNEQSGRVIQQMIIGVVKKTVDPLFGWGHKDTWRPEGMDLDEEEVRAVD